MPYLSNPTPSAQFINNRSGSNLCNPRVVTSQRPLKRPRISTPEANSPSWIAPAICSILRSNRSFPLYNHEIALLSRLFEIPTKTIQSTWHRLFECSDEEQDFNFAADFQVLFVDSFLSLWCLAHPHSLSPSKDIVRDLARLLHAEEAAVQSWFERRPEIRQMKKGSLTIQEIDLAYKFKGDKRQCIPKERRLKMGEYFEIPIKEDLSH